MIFNIILLSLKMNFYGFEKKKVPSHLREECKEFLSEQVEQALYKFIMSTGKGDIEKEYVLAMQQLMSDENVKTQMDRINTGEIGWKHSSIFNDVTDVNEMRDYIQKPLEVEEGVITCRCGSKRVFSYQKQTRGCDESSTTFAQCAQCGQQWTYSG
jgi:DNA-directed RNA polymerase subunit M/transcription elongation factor TFIIS